MENTDLMNYKPERITLEKSFISRLNKTIQNLTEEWNTLSPIAKTIYRSKYDNLLSDATKKLKETITGLRAMKKMSAEDIINADIQNIMEAEDHIPSSKNSFAWLTTFRALFGQSNCFVRETLFDMIDTKDLYSDDIVERIQNKSMPNLKEKNQFERAQTVIGLVNRMHDYCTNGGKIEVGEIADDLLNANFEQLQMPIL